MVASIITTGVGLGVNYVDDLSGAAVDSLFDGSTATFK